jgi:hypothetical protein
MISIELHDDVVVPVAVVVVEVGEIAFFAAGSARPAGPVVSLDPMAAAHHHPMALAPLQRLFSRMFIR